MNREEFSARYAKAQKEIKASPKLKERAMASVQANGHGEADNRRQQSQHTKSRPTLRRRSASTPHAWSVGISALKRWGAPAVACLIAVTLAVTGIPVIISSLREDSPASTAIALDDAAARCGFSIRAYASDGSEVVSPGEGTMIVFDRDWPASASDDLQDLGSVFTGCLFRIEGEGIARVQMNVSGGELYRQDTERFTQSEDPARWQEATNWKELKRGMGEYYGGYDVVYPLSDLSNSDIPITSPDKPLRVNLMKRYGATVDLSAAENPGIATGETSFGLLATPQAQDDTAANPLDAAVDQFESQRLTVTVTFEDGSTATQVIELHAANFRAEHNGNDLIVTSEIIDPNNSNDPAYSERSVYGIIIATDDHPFPLPLDKANEYASEIMPKPTLNRRPDTGLMTGESEGERIDVTLDRSALLSEGDTLKVISPADIGEAAEFVIGCPTVIRSDRPLDGKMFADLKGVVTGFRGDAAYANQCSQQVFGYGFNDDATLTNGDYSYLTASFDITNTSNADTVVRSLGHYAIFEGGEEGHISVVHTSYDLDYTVSANALPGNGAGNFAIAAGDTVRLTILRVLPNYITDNPDLLFVIPTAGPGGVDGAFAIGNQV